MRTMIVVAGALMLAALSGCGTSGANYAGAGNTRFVNDAEYMAKVEKINRAHGVQVEWVNPPTIRQTRDGG